MLYHVRGGLNAKRKPKWVKKLFPEEFGEVADEDSLPIAAADSEPAAADSEPPEVADEVPDEPAAADSDLADGPAAKEDAKYIYGFSWEKMRAWRSKPEVAHGKKALKMWSGEPEEPPNAVETASMIATWKDGSSWSIPDYLVEDARKKKAVKENACRGGDKIVMCEVHKTSGETYKLHWKADRGKLLCISDSKGSQKCQVKLEWIQEQPGATVELATEKATNMMKKIFVDFVADNIDVSSLFDVRDKMLCELGIEPPTKGTKSKKNKKPQTNDADEQPATKKQNVKEYPVGPVEPDVKEYPVGPMKNDWFEVDVIHGPPLGVGEISDILTCAGVF